MAGGDPALVLLRLFAKRTWHLVSMAAVVLVCVGHVGALSWLCSCGERWWLYTMLPSEEF